MNASESAVPFSKGRIAAAVVPTYLGPERRRDTQSRVQVDSVPVAPAIPAARATHDAGRLASAALGVIAAAPAAMSRKALRTEAPSLVAAALDGNGLAANQLPVIEARSQFFVPPPRADVVNSRPQADLAFGDQPSGPRAARRPDRQLTTGNGEEGEWLMPAAVLAVSCIEWGDGRLPTPALLFGPQASSLKILRVMRPVLRDSIPSLAIVFSGSDAKTRLIVSRLLAGIIGSYGTVGESLRSHEEGNEGALGAIVMTVAWRDRERVQQMLLASAQEDLALQRQILRGSMGDQKERIERRLLAEFIDHGGDITRHFLGPRELRYRFSDFVLHDKVKVGVGVCFRLVFDDREVMDFALQRFDEFALHAAARGEKLGFALRRARADSTGDSQNTDFLWSDPIITLVGGLNRRHGRLQAARFLELVCGLDGTAPPLSEALLGELGTRRER